MQFLQNSLQIFYMQTVKFFLTKMPDIYIILLCLQNCIQEYKKRQAAAPLTDRLQSVYSPIVDLSAFKQHKRRDRIYAIFYETKKEKKL